MPHSRTTVKFMIRSPLAYDSELLLFRPQPVQVPVPGGLRIKKLLLASEKERSDVKAARRQWLDRRQPLMRAQPARLGPSALFGHGFTVAA